MERPVRVRLRRDPRGSETPVRANAWGLQQSCRDSDPEFCLRQDCIANADRPCEVPFAGRPAGGSVEGFGAGARFVPDAGGKTQQKLRDLGGDNDQFGSDGTLYGYDRGRNTAESVARTGTGGIAEATQGDRPAPAVADLV